MLKNIIISTTVLSKDSKYLISKLLEIIYLLIWIIKTFLLMNTYL